MSARFPVFLRRAFLLLAVFALFAGVFAGGLASDQSGAAFAEEKKPGEKKDGEEKDGDGKEPGENLGERDVSFTKKVNWAIEYGVNWLKAKPMTFKIKGPLDEPDFSVNALSLLAPGILRKVFSGRTHEPSERFIRNLEREFD